MSVDATEPQVGAKKAIAPRKHVSFHERLQTVLSLPDCEDEAPPRLEEGEVTSESKHHLGPLQEDESKKHRRSQSPMIESMFAMYDTIEPVPSTEFYRAGGKSRPTIRRLLSGQAMSFRGGNALRGGVTSEILKSAKDLFGAFEGVFARCLLNIWGVLMFLRLAWIVGHAGMGYAILIIVSCLVVTVVTTTSMSAVCTNGEVKSGGAYFMISRALGPEFGGAMGFLFAIANAGAVALHLVGFAETVLFLYSGDVTPNGSWDLRLWAIIALLLLISIAVVGVAWVVKFQLSLLVLLALSILSYIIGTFMPPDDELGFTGYNKDTFVDNWNTRWDDESFITLFAVFFPASTGIMAGANISGDLKDPQKAIPVGTLSAVGVAGVVYIVLVLLLGSTLTRTVVGFPNEGLLSNYEIMIETSLVPGLIIAGIFAAGLSSALAALVGAPRIFQAVCNDNLFPIFRYFAKGVGANNEPIRAYVLTFCVAFCFILIGDLNAIAPLITNFFLVSYALINYACFVSHNSNAPGWRPSFRFYNQWVALAGTLVCVVLMFVIDPIMSGITFVCSFVLYKYVDRNPPDVNWGSARDAHVYLRSLELAVRLEDTKEHVKTYRPAFLVLTENPRENLDLVRFTFYFSRMSCGVLNCGHVLIGDFGDSAMTYRDAVQDKFLVQTGVEGFLDTCIAETYRKGYRTLMQTAGMGRLRPNTVVLPFPEGWRNQSNEEVASFVGVIRDAFAINFGVCIARNIPPIDESGAFARPGKRIDCWWLGDDGGLTVLIPHLLLNHSGWKKSKLKVWSGGVTRTGNNIHKTARLVRLLARFRIPVHDCEVTDELREMPESKEAFDNLGLFPEDCPYDHRCKRFLRIGEVLQKHSSDARLVVLTLPVPTVQANDRQYLAWLELCTSVDAPILLVRGTDNVVTMYS